jgi:ribonuclease VapC
VIVLDSSAFIAIQRVEPEAEHFSRLLSLADSVVMAVATYLGCAIVTARAPNGRAVLDAWIAARRISVVPVDHTLAQIAADTFARYGKGRHPAGLNFGDCFAYALARSLNAPLLFTGGDFPRTAVMRAA